ncbi:MAG: HEPN domain-containing protein [Muribaculaceae bacterium]|nr:HEPN domain-containing protein [Muribaculaceae bacterium]
MNTELSPEDRETLISYRLSRAEETLKEAVYNAEGQFYNTAVNRLYYAAYYATSALMLEHGLNATTHAGIKTMLSLHFIRTGKLDVEFGRTFLTLFENRQSGDYEDFVYCDANLFDQLYPKTIAFIEAISKLISK